MLTIETATNYAKTVLDRDGEAYEIIAARNGVADGVPVVTVDFRIWDRVLDFQVWVERDGSLYGEW